MEREKVFPFLLMVVVAACYSNSLLCGLVFDDLAAIRDNRDIRTHTPLINIFKNDFWGTPIKKEYSHKSYRPLTVLTFRLNYAVHGLQAFGYHLVNIILHAFVCILFHRMCLYFLSSTSSIISSLLFAVHPIHTEAVTGIVGRAELLSASAFLSALLYYVHHRYQKSRNTWQDCGTVSIITVAGLLCKEQAVTVLVICCVYELFLPKSPGRLQSIRYLLLGRGIVSPWWKDKLLRIGIFTTVLTLSVYLRCRLIGPRLPVFNRFDNPSAVSEFPTRHMTYNYLIAVNSWLLLFPHYLCCDWTMSTIPLITTIFDVRNMATITVYFVFWRIFKSIYKSEDEIRLATLMGMSMTIIPFIPASNLFFSVGFVVAERVLYIPSMGFCMLVAQGWELLFQKRSYRPFAIIGIVLVIVTGICKTIIRNSDWQTEYTLYKSSLAVNQRNGKLYNNMGQVLESMNRHEEALQHYETAKRIEPDDIRSYLNIGRVLTNLHRYREAEEIYRKAQSLMPHLEPNSEETYVTPSHLQLFLSLAFLISQNNSRIMEADELYKEALSLRSDFTKAYLSRGDFLLKLNRTKEAEAMYHRALEYEDNNPDLYFNLGIVLMDQGRNSEALELFNKALELEPDHEKSLELSAILMHGSGLPNERNLARVRLEKIVYPRKETKRVYLDLGLLSMHSRNFPITEKLVYFTVLFHFQFGENYRPKKGN
nr:protein O-mannosyl-transferase Tmtc3 isoform X2 [Parasteatoda tepidariorum]